MLKIVYHDGYLALYPTSTVESPMRVKIIHGRLKDAYETVTPEHAKTEDILRVHTGVHLNRIRAKGTVTYQTALLAAGGALCAARIALHECASFAVVRPPGHHAGRNRYGGFCFFNNVAAAVASLLGNGEIERAVIIDTDMHHGDGTQEIFAGVPSVSVINVFARERAAYFDLLRRELAAIPQVDMIAVSAGFDLYVRDWGNLLDTRDFQEIGLLIRQAAAEKASGRYFAVLEGGYFIDDLGKNVIAFCRGLEGRWEPSDSV